MMTKTSEWCRFYHSVGINVLPASQGRKFPNLATWKQYQKQRVTDNELEEWLKSGRFQNINACLGSVSNLHEIDVDVPNCPIGLITGNRGDNEIWVCESSEGKIKIFFKTNDTLPTKLDLKVDDKGGHVELRSDMHLTVLPPSLHPTGCTYTWLSDVKNHPLIPIDGRQLYDTVVTLLRAEAKFIAEIKQVEKKVTSSAGVRDFFFKSMREGNPWSGSDGHSFRLAFCAELLNNEYEDEQIHIFFKTHDKNSGEDYSRVITQKKIDELRRIGMHCWTQKKLREQCKDILDGIE